MEKATNSDVCGPKEKHVQTLLEVVRRGASIADVTFLVKYLNRQIVDCARWQTMLKTHVLLHRLLHNSGDEFKDQLKRMQKWVEEDRASDSRIKCMFSIRNWRDDSSVDANELSQWTRSYASYLEECVVNLDKIPRLEQLAAGSGQQSSQPTEMRGIDETALMEKLPRIQNLMRRLLECEAVNSNLTTNDAVIAGVSLLLKDSFKLYRLVNDGIIRLIDVFFTMTKLHAVKALDAYKRATQQGDDLERLFRSCNSWPSFRDTKFPHIENPPNSFMQTMEEYARTAPVEEGGGSVAAANVPVQQRAPVPGPPAPARQMPLEDLMGGFTAPAPAVQTSPPALHQPQQVSPLSNFASAGNAVMAANSLVDAFAAPAQHSSPSPAAVPQQHRPAMDPAPAAQPPPQQQQPPAAGPPSSDMFGMEKPAMAMDLNALYDAPQVQASNPFGGARGGGGYGTHPSPQPVGSGIGSFGAVHGQTQAHVMGGMGGMPQLGMTMGGMTQQQMGQMQHPQMAQMQQQQMQQMQQMGMGGMPQARPGMQMGAPQQQQQFGGTGGARHMPQMGQLAYGMPNMNQPQQTQQQQQTQNNPFM